MTEGDFVGRRRRWEWKVLFDHPRQMVDYYYYYNNIID